MEDLTDLYNDLIMEHSMNSYNKKELDDVTVSEMGHNPNCGDEINLELKVEDGVIKDMAFTGHGGRTDMKRLILSCLTIGVCALQGETVEEAFLEAADRLKWFRSLAERTGRLDKGNGAKI